MSTELISWQSAVSSRTEFANLSYAECKMLVRPTWYHNFKSTLDFFLALVLAIPALPVIFVAAMLVKLTSRGPAFYSQLRVGLNGRPYTIYKLRSMRHNCELESGPCWSKDGDPRITRIGKFLRAAHIDELPQLLNVLRGEMSLVGPRPERPEFVPQLRQQIPLYQARLIVRPGVTGLAQVQLPADTDLESVRRKFAYDLHYIANAGLWMDIRLMLATAVKMVAMPYWMIAKVVRLPYWETVAESYRSLTEEAPVFESPEPCVRPRSDDAVNLDMLTA